MCENIVTESCTNVIDCEEMRGVCAGAAHQIRMINRALREQPLAFFILPFSFVQVCSLCALPLRPSLFLPVLTCSTCTVPEPCAPTRDEAQT